MGALDFKPIPEPSSGSRLTLGLLGLEPLNRAMPSR
jgi:hypothetical protein